MKSAEAGSSVRPTATASSRAVWLGGLPLLLSIGVVACLLLPRVRANPNLFRAFAGVGFGLIVWQLLLWLWAASRGKALRIEAFPPVRQHYVQASVQFCLYVY